MMNIFLKLKGKGLRFKMLEIVGVINITPDSFSDGGKYLHKEDAIKCAKDLILAGAKVLDIGAESTRTSQKPHENIHKNIPSREETKLVNSDEEWNRLLPALPKIIEIAQKSNVKISIDTRNIETIRKIIKHNFQINWINDVTGATDTQTLEAIADTNYQIVIMHNLGIPANPAITIDNNKDVVFEVKSWLLKKIELCNSYGINKDKIIIDPGIGFGKTAEQSLELIKKISEFKDLGCKILVGHSRKSFYNLFTSKPYAERDIETYATSIFLANKKIDYLRVHNVEGNIRTLNIAGELF